MFVSETKIRVRYSETDQMGYVYYGNYASYFEVGRVESLRQLGMSYKEMEESGVMLPVLEYKTKYLKPAKYDDELIVKTIIPEIPSVRIKFDYEIKNLNGDLINVASTTLVFVNKNTNKPCKAPKDFLEKLTPFFKKY